MPKDNDQHSSDPLPPGWTREYSKSQKKYFYFHKATSTTQWHFPTASEAKDPAIAKKRAEEAAAREKKRSATTAAVGTSSSSSNQQGKAKQAKKSNNNTSTTTDDFLELADSTSVAIIVPYRDVHVEQKRSQHLKQFIPHMINFLNKCKKDGLVSDYHIYIIEQSNDGLKFNRGKLLNIGYDMAKKSRRNHDVFIFHDVDLLPADDLKTWYSKFPKRPIHIARVWDRYSNNPKYFGGVVSFSSSDYKRINGYPNNFWGWGGEDDEMQRRLERLGIQFDSPDKGTIKDLENMSINEKMDFLRGHKEWKCMVKWELKDEHESTWKLNGLADLKYNIIKEISLDDNKKSTKATVDVKLNTNNHWTFQKAAMDYLP